MILLIDNYDSFVENLARHVRLAGAETLIRRNDKITLRDVDDLKPEGIILSPGPCTPDEAGICLDLIQHVQGRIPILGICLGHQAIVQAYGGVVKKGPPCHGMASAITHDYSFMFHNIPSPTLIGRYHSLICELPQNNDLMETAQTGDGINMAVQHRQYKIYGLQFHPESILTEHGMVYIQNFLKVAA